MSDAVDDPTPCPSGFPEERVARLVSDSSDAAADRHVESCRRCAQAFFDVAVISALIRHLYGVSLATQRDSSMLGRVRHLRGAGLAAAILLAIGSVAVATAVIVRRPVFIDSDAVTLGRAGDIESATGLRFADAGVEPGDHVVRWVQFTAGPHELGRAAIVEGHSARGSAQLDLVAFAGDGALRWSARSTWNDDELRILDRGRAALLHLPCLVTENNDDGRVQETLAAILWRDEIGALALIDPLSGTLRGTFFHPGHLARGLLDNQVVASAPLAGGGRRLIVFGEHEDRMDPLAHRGACASVLESDGTLVQHIVIPGLGISGMFTPRVIKCSVDWSAGHEAIDLQTSERLWVHLPWRDGRMQVQEASVLMSDALKTAYDLALGDGAYAAWESQFGDADEAAEDVARRVRETPLQPMEHWRDW